MKKSILISVVIGVIALLIGYLVGIYFPLNIGGKQTVSISSKSPKLTNEVDSFSYYYGFSIGQFLEKDISSLNIKENFPSKKFLNGVMLGMEGNTENAIDQMTIQQFMQGFFMKKQTELQAQEAVDASDNLKEGQEFLENNMKKKGVFTTSSGLQYEVIKSGSGGISPDAVDTVIVHYKGTLLDGTVFDSSIDRGEPVRFKLNEVISGWTEGVQLMKTGDKWKFFIPSDLAYGPQKTSELIGPNSTLIFEVELIDVIKSK